MDHSISSHSRNCTHPSLLERGPINLPVLKDHNPSGQIRKSKSGKRRAVVLITVQLLLIAHIVIWILSGKYGWFGGKTISPVEPSESMEFVKDGVVNAGLIFFAAALLGTLIFGRWFCGWGCHIVMLQDFCAWIMKKLGVRPKPFRSRFLIYVPLILALYMFVWPAFYRWGLVPVSEQLSARWSFIPNLGPVPPWQVQSHLTTTEFWKTFPGVMVAIPFLLVCGFATVYFLGAKGFCTYGCPYGGFFAPLDKFAVGRILVTDACEGCGHCTAVCTSNVRVHDEVREYGMVVDPGCMKCLDCVSVCPNEALYFGFGKPSVLKGPAKNKAPKRVFDMTLGEEFAAALVFLITFVSVRGVYGLVPMLMAAGLAGIITFMAWKAWRLLRDQNVNLYRFQFKFKGAIRPAGWVFAGMVVVIILFTLHSGVVNAAVMLGKREDSKIDAMNIPGAAPFDPNWQYLSPKLQVSIDKGLKYYRFGSDIRSGGIGLLPSWQTDIDMRMSRMLMLKRDFAGAEPIIRRALARQGQTDELVSELMWSLYGQGRGGEALDFGYQALIDHEEMSTTLDTFVQFCGAINDTDRLIRMCRERLQRYPEHLKTMRWLSVVLVQTGVYAEGIALVRRTIEIDDKNPSAYRFLAMALADTGDMPGAIDAMHKALALNKDDAGLNSLMADLLESSGKAEEAAKYRQLAQELSAKQGPAQHQH